MSKMFRGLDKTETIRGFTPEENSNPYCCDGCDLYYDGCKHCCYGYPYCSDEQRQDGKNVLYKRIENDTVVVDKDEAPDGYEAIGSYSHVSCEGCDFNIDNKPICIDIDTVSKVSCIADWRDDRCNVVFKKKKQKREPKLSSVINCFKHVKHYTVAHFNTYIKKKELGYGRS